MVCQISPGNGERLRQLGVYSTVSLTYKGITKCRNEPEPTTIHRNY